MDDMNIPVLVKHNEIYVETEKQMDWVYYVGLNMLLAWAIFTFYRTVWSADLVFDGYMLSAEYVLRCFKKWLAVAVALGMLLTWHERIGENAIITALFPFEGYTLLHVIQYYKTAVAGIYLALVTAVLNMISGICFAFSAGLSGMWLYWLAAALLIASAIGGYVRWQKLKYGE